MNRDHLLFYENSSEDEQHEDSDECDYCDGSGKYWETNKDGEWIKVVCICVGEST